jgi:hypothetical protein
MSRSWRMIADGQGNGAVSPLEIGVTVVITLLVILAVKTVGPPQLAALSFLQTYSGILSTVIVKGELLSPLAKRFYIEARTKPIELRNKVMPIVA